MTVEGRVTDYDQGRRPFRQTRYCPSQLRRRPRDAAATSSVPQPSSRRSKSAAAPAIGWRRSLGRAASSDWNARRRSIRADARARRGARRRPRALVRGRAEDLPWRDATFDRVFCVNALHHFADRNRFFAEARRVLKPGGGLLTIGKDPHTDRDAWWVYEYFEETRAIDLQRFARVRTLRGEMALAGFAWTESREADHLEVVRPAAEALTNGIVDRGFTSQLTVLSDRGVRARRPERVRRANAVAPAANCSSSPTSGLYATIGWTAPIVHV